MVKSLKAEHDLEIQIERAAIKKFKSIQTFLNLFPKASYIYERNLIDPCFSKTIDLKFIYNCKLPKFTTNNNIIIFEGEPVFKRSELLFQGQSGSVGNTKIVTINEIQNEFNKSKVKE